MTGDTGVASRTKNQGEEGLDIILPFVFCYLKNINSMLVGFALIHLLLD